jgi:putative tryptophan/tyrosine transport system substrate-binding protein
MISRRGFLGCVSAGLLGAPALIDAEEAPAKVYRVGLVFATSPLLEMLGPEPLNPAARGLVQGLRALGYAEGRNLILDRRSGEGRLGRLGDIVAELMRLDVDVIVSSAAPITRAVRAVTTTLPIVGIGGDPVGDGFARSLARPGGNVTGLAGGNGPATEGKRLQLFREALPGIARIAYLCSQQDHECASPFADSIRLNAKTLGVTLVEVEYQPRQWADVFARINQARAEAVYIGGLGGVGFAERRLIVDFANQAMLPSCFLFRESVEAGGLMSYGAGIAEAWRRGATYVDRILKGAKPADLPIEQPTTVGLVINMKTARALGLTIPPSVLHQATAVIE